MACKKVITTPHPYGIFKLFLDENKIRDIMHILSMQKIDSKPFG